MKPQIYWIDLFCGAGGTTTGIHLSENGGTVVACVNHDPHAIHCHKNNHPECIHFTEDIRDFEVVLKLKTIVDKLRNHNPRCIINIWASLECTHFSNAAGGVSRDADSRTLANHLFKYIEQLDPDYIYIENVREFLTWGPLNDQGRPIQKLKCTDYQEWANNICFYGYDYDYRLLNSADFGAYTSRLRYFGVFGRKGMPISFPKPTHAKNDTNLKKWRPVKEVLDFTDEGASIFGKNKQGKAYSENTLKRVYAGLIKFANEGLFIKRYNGGDPEHKSTSINSPLGTILTSRTHALVKPVFLTSYYGNGNAHSIESPCNTLTTKDRYAAHFINYDYSSPTHSSVEMPAGTITTNPKHNLVKCSWMFDTQYSNAGRSVDRPAQTLIAKMDKKPIYLASAVSSGNQQQDQPNDSEIVNQIRSFMRSHGIADIKIRMLRVDELLRIQGFPPGFDLTGTKVNQLKFIGNSVAPIMSQVLSEANYQALITFFQSKKAI